MGCGTLALSVLVFVTLWRRVRIISFALVWIFLTLLPFLDARWAPTDFFAEGNLYLASAGFCWIVGWAAVVAWSGEASVLPRLLARAVPVALLVVAMLYGVRTVRRNKDWATDETLYRRTLEVQPEANAIRVRLGSLLLRRGDLSGAERELQQTISGASNNSLALTAFALSNLGLLRARQSRADEALSDASKAVDTDPENLFAQLTLADMLATLNYASEAESHYQRAISISPLSVAAHSRYAQFLLDAGRLDEARNQFETSVGADPTPDAYISLGDIYTKWQDWKRAESAYENAIALSPRESRAHIGLGKLYEADGRPGDALREIESGLAIDPSNTDAQDAAVRLRGKAPQLPNAVPQ